MFFQKRGFFLFAAALLSFGAGGPAASSTRVSAQPHWVGSWASAQQEPEPHNALPASALANATLRQLVRTTLGGKRIRVRVSNAFGKAPLKISGVNVAKAQSPSFSRIVEGTDRAVTFSGMRQIILPAGAEYVSDPVDLVVPALTTLSISMHLPEQPPVQTSHPGSRATSYLAEGERLSALEFVQPRTVDHWYQLSGVDVVAAPDAAAIAVLGDSIVDGFGVEPNTDTRWPDFLAERLQSLPATRGLGLLNLGMGGNRLLQDGLGPNGTTRFERDVLGRSGVRYLIVLIGVNDLGGLARQQNVTPADHQALVAQMLTAYAQIVQRAREHGIKVIGATILPYGGSDYYKPSPANEADRQAVNAWIRKAGNFDAVIDFDAAMRNPAQPHLLRSDYDSGDGLHPSQIGYRAMAAAIPLTLFRMR